MQFLKEQQFFFICFFVGICFNYNCSAVYLSARVKWCRWRRRRELRGLTTGGSLSVATTSTDYHEEQLEVNCFTFSVERFFPIRQPWPIHLGRNRKGACKASWLTCASWKQAGWVESVQNLLKRNHRDAFRVILCPEGGICIACMPTNSITGLPTCFLLFSRWMSR